MSSIALRNARTPSSRKISKQPGHASSAFWKQNVRRKELPNKRSAENDYRVSGSVLDELGLDRQSALELKLKAALHQKILKLIRRRKRRARDLERILHIQQPRVSELIRGKISTLSVARLLLYADLLGAKAEIQLRQTRAKAAA
jgi:predicted XRE-type DNA-binding protein